MFSESFYRPRYLQIRVVFKFEMYKDLKIRTTSLTEVEKKNYEHSEMKKKRVKLTVPTEQMSNIN